MTCSILRAVLRHYPLNTPRASLLRLLPAVPVEFGPFRAKHGQIVSYYPGRDHISASLFWLGDFDPWVDRTLRRLSQPGESVLDIGANIGATCLVLASAVGVAGRVVAFEPLPENIEFLRGNITANGLDQVEIQECALSDQEGELALVVPVGQPGMTSVMDAQPVDGVRVGMRTLDSWFDEDSRVGTFAVAKIDVEGHELAVLKGAKQTLSEGRIGAIVFEEHSPDLESPTFRLLEDEGYEVFRIAKTPFSVRYLRLRSPHHDRLTSDYVAIRAGTESARRLGLS